MTDVQKFLEQIDQDSSVKQKFVALDTNEEIIAFAKELGYSITLEDYEKELENKLDLGKITGGAAMDSGPAQCPRGWPTAP